MENKTGNIFIEESEDNFKKVNKNLINDGEIDCLTLGIYVKILTLGKSWKLYIQGLSSILNVSDNKIRKSISLLEKKGYVARHAVKDDEGKFKGWDYHFYSEPIDELERTCAGKRTSQKTDTPQFGQDRKRTTPKTDNTENGQDNIYRLNTTIDLNKEVDSNNSSEGEKGDNDVDAFVEHIYAMYPSKCPKRNISLGKSTKDKDRIRKLLKQYSREQIEQVVAYEVQSKYNKSYMSNFSTFLNNFPDPSCIDDLSRVKVKLDNEGEIKDGTINAKGEVWSEQLQKWLK